MSTKLRRQFILDYIAKNEINKQEDLVAVLNKNGYNVTQATVSRDINELKLVKVEGQVLKTKYAVKKTHDISEIGDEKIITLLKTFVTSVEYAKNLVVVKTLSGNGASCGMAIDKIKFEGVLGSVAGDDTLLIVAHSEEDAKNVVESINSIIG